MDYLLSCHPSKINHLKEWDVSRNLEPFCSISEVFEASFSPLVLNVAELLEFKEGMTPKEQQYVNTPINGGETLKLWREKFGPYATYDNLLWICCVNKIFDAAEAILDAVG